MTWRVNREAVLLLGGGRALLLQVAHPLVAAGVAEHSNFRAAPLTRLWRTLDLMLTITFADAARAMRAIREIERVHTRVHGLLDADVGPFPRGTPYRADDPALLFWVHATLVDTALFTYERFVAPLTSREKLAYYEESKVGARLFGVPDGLIPPTFRDFRAYMKGMIRGDTLAVGPASKEIAASILRPPLPPGARQVFRAANLFTAGLLPPTLRRRYGLSWGPRRQSLLNSLAALTRRAWPLLPPFLRSFRYAH
jgi:uncharacterized protein (DUF2236 family)